MRILRILKMGALWVFPLGLAATFAGIMGELNLVVTAVLTTLLAGGTVVLNLLNWIRSKIWQGSNHRAWRNWLIGLVGALGGLVGMSGVMESYGDYPMVTILSAQAAFFLPAAAWYHLSQQRMTWLRLLLWSVAISLTLVFVVMVAYEVEPIVGLFSAAYFLTFITLAVRWIVRQIQAILRLRKEKKTAELLHLKSQVNPHFFFNMLNNLYGLVAKDGKQAQQLILKLSELMRYGIYEGQKELVPLENEIDYLKNYVALHRMRYHKEIEVDFTVQQSEREWEVMPLLFIILLENAFKHGVENLRSGAYVKVDLKTTEKAIHFRVENNFDPEEDSVPPGIGLANLKRRLELAYPHQYNYSVHRTADTYAAELTLHAA